MLGASVAGERKVVTAVFADVVGSTVLAEQMDAEEWTNIMNRAFDQFSLAIYRYEGTVARLLGDAILAFFGAPVAHEDDPVRAVNAALAIIATTKEYAEAVYAQRRIDFAVRVGINTGPVIVGEVGNNLKYEYTAMGDAVNLSARMQSAARPMNVLISANTYRFVAPYFDVNDLGFIDVKGKSDRVRVYEVIGAKANPGKLRGLAGLESPMVGRAVELASLEQLGAANLAGKGGIAVITGEAGLGKTRLIAEWRTSLRGRTTNSTPEVRWAEGHCLSYGQGMAYHLIVDMLRSLINITDTADELEARTALHAYVKETIGDSGENIYPYLGHLLMLHLEPVAAERVQSLDPQGLQVQYLNALRELLSAQTSRGPLILVLDDIHWVDPSSAELLIKLLSLTGDAPVLFCFVTRPDSDTPGWRLLDVVRRSTSDRLVEIDLHPLSDSDSRQLVSNLLEVEALPDHVRAIILQKAEGNPFFVEEVIRMLIDHNAIIRQGNGWAAGKAIDAIDIPDNLQGLLLARIDRLPEDAKRTLRIASVIGRQFSVQLLEQVLASG
ncbi:MAG TPA: adenylate/guanylate cyclase domain-containing protein [Anaerolineae bacterium]